MPNPPKWAKLKPGVSLTLDKSWGQRQKFCEKYGNLPVSQFSRKHASAILAKLSDTPEAAKTLMKRLRLLLNFAVDIGMIPSNPMAGMKGYKSDGEGYHDWTE